jgi:bifunctional UDP-N-acetylglucosamine pyrophosphorylase/glucosamine-1-phosphate N-acetyltransferase/UDP-N-acetylglucosamine pyrophosphorylase
MSNPVAVVLAAGKGTRMKSDRPKVLFEALGRHLIDHVIDSLQRAGVERILVVVGYRGDDVRRALAGHRGVEFVEQSQQLGTGHAVQVCRGQLDGHDGPVLIVAGDSPLIQSDSVRRLLGEYQADCPACILGTLHKADPSGLGRILRDESGRFLGIVEDKDATDSQRQITEVNMSTYVFHGPDLLHALQRLRADNRQQEYYLTDCPGILRAEGKDVRALAVLQPCEALSVNTLDELAVVENELRRLGHFHA